MEDNEIETKNEKDIFASKSNVKHEKKSEERNFYAIKDKHKIKNIFSFIRIFMRNASVEMLNLFEVANAFTEKLSEFDLQSK